MKSIPYYLIFIVFQENKHLNAGLLQTLSAALLPMMSYESSFLLMLKSPNFLINQNEHYAANLINIK